VAFYSDKYDLFLTATQSFCHKCGDLKQLIDTHIVSKDNEVFLRKFCPKCGESMVKISTDYEYFQKCNEYIAAFVMEVPHSLLVQKKGLNDHDILADFA